MILYCSRSCNVACRKTYFVFLCTTCVHLKKKILPNEYSGTRSRWELCDQIVVNIIVVTGHWLWLPLDKVLRFEFFLRSIAQCYRMLHLMPRLKKIKHAGCIYSQWFFTKNIFLAKWHAYFFWILWIVVVTSHAQLTSLVHALSISTEKVEQ